MHTVHDIPEYRNVGRQPPHSRHVMALLCDQPFVHLAYCQDDGLPGVRAVHAVVHDDALVFHGKPDLAGRQAVATTQRFLTIVPSYLRDKHRGCRAMSLYEQAWISGRVESVFDPKAKCELLESLMQRYQPEKGYDPFSPKDQEVGAPTVYRMRLDDVRYRSRLLESESDDRRCQVLTGLWVRGYEGDPATVMRVVRAEPARPVPTFLQGPAGTRLDCHPDRDALPEAVALVRNLYWNKIHSESALRRAHAGCNAWVVARDGAGCVVGTARALADVSKHAWICDVAVAPAWRGRGVGAAVVRLLLDHPAVRGVLRCSLRTKDAQAFYARFGFEERRSSLDPEMVLEKDPPLGRVLMDPSA